MTCSSLGWLFIDKMCVCVCLCARKIVHQRNIANALCKLVVQNGIECWRRIRKERKKNRTINWNTIFFFGKLNVYETLPLQPNLMACRKFLLKNLTFNILQVVQIFYPVRSIFFLQLTKSFPHFRSEFLAGKCEYIFKYSFCE